MYKYAFLVISVCFFAVIVVCFVFLLLRHLKTLDMYNELNLYLKKLSNSISSARYGNFIGKIEQGPNKNTQKIAKDLNNLFESVLDRDKMISEYTQKEIESNSIKEDFYAMLSHDLKVPIIAQDKTYDLLLKEKFGALTLEQKEVIKNIKISNNDLKLYVEGFLEARKFEENGFCPNYEKNVDLKKYLKDIISQLHSFCVSKNKEIRFFDEIKDNVFIETDKLLLSRAICNLLFNAIYHGTKSNFVDVILEIKNAKLIISIKDYGDGIDAKNINKIFDKYYTKSKNNASTGLGLGLYLSNKIAQALKGEILVQSEVNVGTTFSIVLPLA